VFCVFCDLILWLETRDNHSEETASEDLLNIGGNDLRPPLFLEPETRTPCFSIHSTIMSSPIVDINNDTEAKAASLLDAAASSSAGHKSVLFFWAEWHAPSAAGGPFDMVVKALAGQNSGDGVKIYRVLAEEAPTLSQKVCVSN
jgi:hypothetical protein